jgi:hypothetical protein
VADVQLRGEPVHRFEAVGFQFISNFRIFNFPGIVN